MLQHMQIIVETEMDHGAEEKQMITELLQAFDKFYTNLEFFSLKLSNIGNKTYQAQRTILKVGGLKWAWPIIF